MAGNAGSIKAGQAYIEIAEKGFDLVQTKLKNIGETFKKVGQSVSSAGSKLMKLGGGMLAPLGGAVKLFSDMGDEMSKAADRTGMSVESLSALKYAAEQSGTSLEDLQKGLIKSNRTLAAAVDGNAAARESFAGLGLNWKDLAAMSPEQRFMAMADAVDKISDPAERAAAAMNAFGKAGINLLPMLKGGSAAIQELIDRAKKLGIIVSTEDAKAATEFGDLLADLWAVMKMGVFLVGSALVPVLKPLVEQFIEGAKVVSTWIKENKPLIVLFAKIALGVIAAGAGLYALGSIISGVGTVFGILATGVGIAKSVFLGLMWAFKLLASPVALIVLGIIGLTAYFSWMCSEVKDQTTTLADVWAGMKDDFGSAWGGIIAALKNGDFQGVMQILWAFIKLEWKRGILWLEEKWIAWKDGLKNIWTEAVYGLAETFLSSVGGLLKGFASVAWFFRTLWTQTLGWFAKAWNAATVAVSKGWEWIKHKLHITSDAEYEQNWADIEEQARQDDADAARKLAAQQSRIDNDLKKKREEYDKDTAAALKIVEDEKRKVQKERYKKSQEALQGSKDEVAAAKAEFEKIVQEVKDRNKKPPEETPGRERTKADLNFDKSKKTSLGLMQRPESIEASEKKYSSVGTLSAFALRGINGNRIETILTKIEKNTRKQDQLEAALDTE